MYDAWAAYLRHGWRRWLLGRTRSGVECTREDLRPARTTSTPPARRRSATPSTALIFQRFRRSPGVARIRRDINPLMGALGHDPRERLPRTTPRVRPPALGNHIAQCYLDFGFADGANEADDYGNTAYEPVNPALEPELPGNPDIVDLNRWQPLALETFIDQAGNPAQSQPGIPEPRVGPGRVLRANRVRPGPLRPRRLHLLGCTTTPGCRRPSTARSPTATSGDSPCVAIWSSHLSPDDGVTIDISPASLGNVEEYPRNFEDYPDFFDTLQGGDPGAGYDVNPVTGEPYAPQVVPRGDYTRVLAEFWADGPDSETPPGHWFTILNEVNEHELLERRFRGMGEPLGHLEWDVKAYFALGGAMHDRRHHRLGHQGLVRLYPPHIAAIRAMTDRGQSSDSERASYHVDGIPLEDGYIELVKTGDELAGDNGRARGQDQAPRLAWPGPHRRPGNGRRRRRLDPRGALVALSAPDLRDAALRRIHLGCTRPTPAPRRRY